MSTNAETIEQGFDRDATPRTDMVSPLNTELEGLSNNDPAANAATVSPLIHMLASGGLTAETIETAIALQEKHDAIQARKAYSVAMAQFRSMAPVLTKDAHVSFKNGKGQMVEYDHVTLANIMTTCNPLLAECDLNLSWHPVQSDGYIHVETRVTHVLGHSESITLSGSPDNSGNKNPIQAMKSTLTYLQRAGAESLLGLASGHDDDGHGAALQPEPPANEPPPEPMNDKSLQVLDDLLSATEPYSDTFAKNWLDTYRKKFGESDNVLGIAFVQSKFEAAKADLEKRLKAMKAASEAEADKAAEDQDAPL